MGYDVLNTRQTKNTISCMFLLTDGIDDSRLAEKKALAAAMKAEGISLYIFGFGADHDSNHLNQIATAAESTFIYIADTDQVIDAFGGALGSQQGLAAKNVQLVLTSLQEDLVFEEVNAGEYKVNLAAGSKTATITYTNLFVGENRDVLVRMRVPAVSTAVTIPQYPLFELSALYTPIVSGVTSADTAPIVLASTPEENDWCTVARCVGASATAVPANRHNTVDVHMYRLKVTELLKRAMDMGDRQDVSAAKKLLEDCLAEMKASSISYQSRHPITVQLEADLNTAIQSLSNEAEYSRGGGRALMTEAYTSNVQQRCHYSKSSMTNAYQSAGSSSMQTTSAAYKKSMK